MEEVDLALAAALEPSVAAEQAEERLPAVAMEADGRAVRLFLEQQAHMVQEAMGVTAVQAATLVVQALLVVLA